MNYPKRLIEVDLPIKRISAHARREKSIRHGHISTLHIWWARRPLAACRAVICAALWPDPADVLCPDSFVQVARREMLSWTTHERQRLLSSDSRPRFESVRKDALRFNTLEELRGALLDFIADFANWNNSILQEYLDTSRTLTRAAHEALGGAPGTRPLVIDPFAGGGSIPLEALRVGADAFASDLNPVAVLLNKVILEYAPEYGQRLADEVREWGKWIKGEAEKELGEFYPKDSDGATPIAYLWARTIRCEGPGCGAVVPLVRSLWIAKKGRKSVALQMVPQPESKSVNFRVIENVTSDDVHPGTVRLGSVTCPCCGFTTPVQSVRKQILEHQGGAADAQLICVVTTKPDRAGRIYRAACNADLQATWSAKERLEFLRTETINGIPSLPDESPPHDGTGSKGGGYRTRKYGITEFGRFFAPRQALALTTLTRLVNSLPLPKTTEPQVIEAIRVCLAISVSRHSDMNASLAMWHTTRELVTHVFGRQALPMVWDFAEVSPLGGVGGSFASGVEWVCRVIERIALACMPAGTAASSSATKHPLPDDSADAFITDPPYYDSVPYADLSDFFFVWLKRMLPKLQMGQEPLTPKSDECVVDLQRGQDRVHFQRLMKQALSEGRRVARPNGIGLVVFAHKSTDGWEAQLQAMIDAGWFISASWPIDTEMENRLRAHNSAVLASSVHLVCRPRENADGSVRTDQIGDWRDVLQELPRRIHEWMPRLAKEGVVGADAIFACLGPALELFSRYSRVEKTSGDVVSLREYLEQVWAAVAKEALSMVFEGADASGFEPDARITAIWLWTLNAGKTDAANSDSDEEEEGDDESEVSAKKPKTAGFVLEYDAARKLAQGLGAHLETLGSLVEVSGDQARLLPVAERARYLFGKDEGKAVVPQRKKREAQMDLFKIVETAEAAGPAFGETKLGRVGETVLDRIHQSMILFAAGRGEALKRLLVEGEVGHDPRFWRLAQALAALYPKGSDERRWVEGVLARKKGVGL